ncbi:MAG: hypothetical protein ACXU9U_01200 [Parachlamydiaceae bacterium]
MSFSISLNRCSPDSLSNSHLESLFATLEQYMAQEQFDKAVGELYSCFRHTQSEGEVQKCYQFLFELFSHCTSLCDLVENNLPNLLKNSVSFVKEQEQLALLLARRYLQKGNLKTAMLCFAKALQMNRSQDNYLAALEVFLLYFQSHKEQRLDSFLISSVPTPDTIASHIGTIKTLKALGIPKEDLIPFLKE